MRRHPTPADLPEDAARFAQSHIGAGRDAAKLAALRSAIDEGEASGVAEGDAFARVRARLGIRQR